MSEQLKLDLERPPETGTASPAPPAEHQADDWEELQDAYERWLDEISP